MVPKTNTVTFEEALTMAGFGKFNIILLLVNSSMIMAMTFETMSVSYLVPASACELQTTVPQQGLMAGVPMLGVIATSHMWGYLADVKGRTKTLGWSLAVSFMAGALNSLSPNWIVFSFLKFLSSSSAAGTYALSLTLLSECTLQSKRSAAVALSTTTFLGSISLMAILSGSVLDLPFSYYIPFLDITFNSWRFMNFIFVLPSAIGAVCMYFSYESPRYLLIAGEEEKALKVMRGIFSINTGRPKEEYEVNSIILGEETVKPTKGLISSIVSQTLPLLKPPLLKKTLLVSVMFIMVHFGINPFMIWLPYIVNAVMTSVQNGDENLTLCEMIRASQNSTTSGHVACSFDKYAMLAVFGINIILAILNVVLSSLVNVVGRKRMLLSIQIFAGAAGLCLNISSIWKVNVFLLVCYVCGVLNFGFLVTICVEVFPTYVKAMAVCLTMMVGRGSTVLGINILKNMMQSNCEAAVYIFAGLAFAGGFYGLILPDCKSQKKDENAT